MSALAAWRRWQAAAGPWRGYAVCPALQIGTANAQRRVPGSIPLPRWRDLFSSAATAVVVDLDPLVGVRLAAEASQRRLAHAVLVLPRWPHAEAVLPCTELVALLELSSHRLVANLRAQHVIFVLDADRANAIAPRRTGDARVDNRYGLGAGDLPTLQTLRVAGIQRVVKLSRAP